MDVLSLENRKALLDSINSNANKERKAKAKRVYDIFKGKIRPHVVARLLEQFDEATVREIPIVSTINIAKKMITQEASIYRKEPTRSYVDMPDSDKLVMDNIYFEGRFDTGFKKANALYKLFKDHVVIHPILEAGKIKLKSFAPHQYDVITDPEDDSKAIGYVFKTVSANSEENQRYVLWTKEYNFEMDGNGLITSLDVVNHLGMLPFVDVAEEKAEGFFQDITEGDSDFTVEYNCALSDLQNICRLQGYAQAVYVGDGKALPKKIKTGPNHVLMIPVNPDQPINPSFSFVSPNPNIDGQIKQIEQLLANYLTCRGVDASSISGALGTSNKYSSGYERLLALIDKFEASSDDISMFQWAEFEVFKIVAKYAEVYSRTDKLDQKYHVSSLVSKSDMTVKFVEPEIVQSPAEKVADVEARIRLGIADEVTALMELKNMTEEQALEEITKLMKRSIALKLLKKSLEPIEEVEDEQDQDRGE